MTTQELKTKLLVTAREETGEMLDKVDPSVLRIGIDSRIFIKDEVGMILSSALSQMEEAVREEIKENIVQFAIENKSEPDEMKGLTLYTKILTYFESLKKE